MAIPYSRDQFLYCLRVGIAVAVAYVLSHGSDPAGALYAVLAAALIVGETAGEGIGISRNRLIGTLIGVVVAVPLAAFGGISVWTVAAASLIAGLITLLVGEIPTARVAFTVAIVSMMYHASDLTHYGIYRVTNTLLGVGVAIAVSYAFWPLAGRHTLVRVMRQVLAESADLLETVAVSNRPDLRQRRQRSVFKALAALPKAHKEAGQDPVHSWHSALPAPIFALVVEIGMSALTLSAAVARFSPAWRDAAWWPELAGLLKAAAGRLQTACGHLPMEEATTIAATPPTPAVAPALIDEPARQAVDDVCRHMRLMNDRLDELQRHLRTSRRVAPNRSRAPA